MPVFVDRYRKPNSRYPNVSFKPSGIHATQSSPDSGDAALECATKCSPAASGGRPVTTIHTAPYHRYLARQRERESLGCKEDPMPMRNAKSCLSALPLNFDLLTYGDPEQSLHPIVGHVTDCSSLPASSTTESRRMQEQADLLFCFCHALRRV